jgi:hypothetical protein
MRPDASAGSSRGELSTAVPREAKPPEHLDSVAVFMVIQRIYRNTFIRPALDSGLLVRL